jgi:hypothetical protein
LNPDHLVVRRDDVFPPEGQLVMIVRRVCVRILRFVKSSGRKSIHSDLRLILSIRQNFSSGKPVKFHFSPNFFPPLSCPDWQLHRLKSAPNE